MCKNLVTLLAFTFNTKGVFASKAQREDDAPIPVRKILREEREFSPSLICSNRVDPRSGVRTIQNYNLSEQSVMIRIILELLSGSKSVPDF